MSIARAEVLLRGKDETAQAFRDVVRNAQTAGQQIESKFKSAFKFAAGSFIAAQLGMMVRNAAQAGDEMLNLASRTGRSVESISQLDFVAKRGNISLERLILAEDRLAKGMGATNEEGKKVVKVLDEIGLSANTLRAMSPDQRLDAIADAMGGVTDPTARARIELTLFGRAGTDLDPVLNNTAAGIRALREESDKFGHTLTTLEAQRLRKLDDQLDSTAAAVKKLKLEFVGLIATPVGSYFQLLTQGLMGWKVLLGVTGDEMEELRDRTRNLRAEQKELNALTIAGATAPWVKERAADIELEIRLIRERQDYLVGHATSLANFEAKESENRGKRAAAAEEAAAKLEAEAEAAEEAAKAWAKLNKATQDRLTLYASADHFFGGGIKFDPKAVADMVEQSGIQTQLNMLELKFPTPIFDDAALKSELEKTDELVEKHLEQSDKVLNGMFKNLKDEFTVTADAMTVVADQAWRNIQTSLARFFFDPFQDGLDGMLKGFIDVIRQMLAEAASARLLEALGMGKPGGGFLGTILGAVFGSVGGGGGGGSGAYSGPRLASGGFIPPGGMALTGEDGPEFQFGGHIGKTIVPIKAGGGGVSVTVAPVYKIDARGADIDLAQRLPTILIEANRAAVTEAEARIVEGLKRHRYDFG